MLSLFVLKQLYEIGSGKPNSISIKQYKYQYKHGGIIHKKNGIRYSQIYIDKIRPIYIDHRLLYYRITVESWLLIIPQKPDAYKGVKYESIVC